MGGRKVKRKGKGERREKGENKGGRGKKAIRVEKGT